MEYNTEREHLIIPEYGRHVQKMIAHATNLKDKVEQQKCVNAIIAFMGQRNPHLRDIKDFTHKLWDHLFIMSDFQIDVESPYPKPEKEKLEEKPKKMDYPKTKIRFPFYGVNIEKMIAYACTMEEGELKEIMAGMIANHMKKDYICWNKAFVNDETILKHLNELSEGKVKTHADFQLIDDKDIQKPRTYIKLKKKGKNYKYKKGYKRR
tara:strand:+ start:1432 stop:2055 length:624 start_codon:yes stop_codon:yes gene_type:complete